MASFEFEIQYKDLDHSLEISFNNIMEYLQETSIRHADQAGYSLKWYKKNMLGFMLINWQIEVYDYPTFGDTIKVITYPTFFKGFFAERIFIAEDSKGNIIAKANSRWVYMDIKNQKPVRTNEKLIEDFGGIRESTLEKDYKFSFNDDYIKVNECSFITTRQDIDSNEHVNNLRYIAWITDLLTDEEYDNHKITHMKVEYKKECKNHTPITAKLFKNQNIPNEYYGVISGEDCVHVNIWFRIE